MLAVCVYYYSITVCLLGITCEIYFKVAKRWKSESESYDRFGGFGIGFHFPLCLAKFLDSSRRAGAPLKAEQRASAR